MSASAPSPAKRVSVGAKRASTAAPRPPMTLSSRCIIASHASIVGINPVTISPYVTMNPYAKIMSITAPVFIDEGCILWEKGNAGIQPGSLDEAKLPLEVRNELSKAGVRLGKNVVVESMAIVEASEVGEGTIVESGAKVGVGCVIGKHCTITPGTILPPMTKLPDFTIATGAFQRRTNATLRDRNDLLTMKDLNHERQLQSLRALIPNNLAKWQ